MKFRKIIMLIAFSLLLMNTQCDNDDVVATLPCDLEVVIDNANFEETEAYYIEGAIIDGDCISLIISDSGCDSENWIMTLIDSENIAESMPPQRYLKLTLYNDEVCLAYFSKQQSFDLIPLRIEGTNEVLLNIEGFEEPILYAY